MEGIEVNSDLSQLPPQVQERLLRFQQVQQTLQSVLAQKQQVEAEIAEIDQALNELQKLPDGATVYKSAGSLFMKAEKPTLVTELTERKELLNTRVSILRKQEERLRVQAKDLQTRIEQDLKPVSPPP